ncbi:MAG: hypothetical protein ACM3ZB_16425 [bacterium]
MSGRHIHVRVIPDPHALNGRLLSGGVRGQEVHAGSRIPAREMVLDVALLDHPHEFARIFLHELFHFVWVRLGNQCRYTYEQLLMGERAGGELGWSAEMRKLSLTPADVSNRSRRWREYACESFCDTGSWYSSGIAKHPEFTLPGPARHARHRWFAKLCSRDELRF